MYKMWSCMATKGRNKKGKDMPFLQKPVLRQAKKDKIGSAMSMASPSFQFYPGDWLKSQRIALMSLEEEGAYIRLLCYCWQYGSIPSDVDRLTFLIGKGGSTTLSTTLSTMFQPHPSDSSKLVHDRLDEERKKQAAWREKSSLGGKKSAEARKKRKKATKVQPPLVPPLTPPLVPPLTPPLVPKGNSSVFSLQSSDKEDIYTAKSGKELRGQNLVNFLEFWEAFDYKRGKAEAADSWYKISPDADLFKKILSEAKEEALKRPKLLANNGTPKMAQGWLNGRRWEDGDGRTRQTRYAG